MIQSPYTECPPDEPIVHLDLKINLVGDYWEVCCPQWKFDIQASSLTRTVACLIAEIENFNMGQMPGEFDWNKFAAANNCLLLKKEHWPKPSPKQFGRRRKPLPDDGRKTPRQSLWQAAA